MPRRLPRVDISENNFFADFRRRCVTAQLSLCGILCIGARKEIKKPSVGGLTSQSRVETFSSPGSMLDWRLFRRQSERRRNLESFVSFGCPGRSSAPSPARVSPTRPFPAQLWSPRLTRTLRRRLWQIVLLHTNDRVSRLPPLLATEPLV